jgi:hypothetical protein
MLIYVRQKGGRDAIPSLGPPDSSIVRFQEGKMNQFTSTRRFISSLNRSAIRGCHAKRTALLLAAVPLLSGNLSLAQDFWINPSGGSWTDAANWSEGVPIGNDAVFNLGSIAGYTVTEPTMQELSELDVDTDNVTLNMTAPSEVGFLNDGDVQVGTASDQNGSLTLHGADLGSEDGANVGTNGGIGVLTTTTTIETFEGGGFIVGSGSGSQGTMNVNAGGALSPDLPGNLEVGISNGTGTVNINGGSVSDVIPVIGSDGTGTLALTNKGSLSTFEAPADLIVGQGNAVGTVTCDNSSMDVEGDTDIGETIRVPATATGTVTLTNGSNSFQDGGLNIGIGAGANGSLSVLSGSSVDNLGPIVVGANGGTGSLVVSGANSLFSSLFEVTTFVGEDSSSNPGTGTLQVDTQGTISLASPVIIAAGGTLNVLSGGTFSAPSIDLSSAGSVNLTGGIVDLTGGTLTDSALSIPKTTTLEGTGTLTGNLSNSGNVSPGDAPGILKINGNYSQDSGGVLDIGIGGTTLGTQYDQLDIVGSATLEGSLDLTLLNGFTPSIGNQFNVIGFGSETGVFSNIGLPALPAGRFWDTSQLYSSGIISVVVPEPVGSAMLIAAGVGLAYRRRRTD